MNIQIMGFTRTSITVLSSKNIMYEYGDFNSYWLKKLKRLLKHENYGEAWQLLKKFPLWTRRELC